MENGVSAGELALMQNDGFGGNGFMWIFALLILLGMGNGGFGFGNANRDSVTQADMTAGFNNQNTQNQLQALQVATANNNYETAQLIHAQSVEMQQLNNTNLVNAIQGFNTVNQNIQNQTNVLQGTLMQLGAQMNECCCSIKTQMLQDKYEQARTELLAAQNNISNYNQSQYILGQMGRFVAWAGSGSQATSSTT